MREVTVGDSITLEYMRQRRDQLNREAMLEKNGRRAEKLSRMSNAYRIVIRIFEEEAGK